MMVGRGDKLFVFFKKKKGVWGGGWVGLTCLLESRQEKFLNAEK